MNRHGSRRKGIPPKDFLTINDIFFCNEYLTNGQNGTQAYLKVHPKAVHATGKAEAVRVLAKPAVRDHIARIVQAAVPDTIETIKKRLELAYSLALDAKDHAAIAAISMDVAKLTGLLVEKHQVEQVGDSERGVVRSLIADAVRPQAN